MLTKKEEKLLHDFLLVEYRESEVIQMLSRAKIKKCKNAFIIVYENGAYDIVKIVGDTVQHLNPSS